jgi:hypothetical protein
MKKFLFLLMLFPLFAMSQSFTQTVSNPTGAITNTSVDTMNITTPRDFTSVGIQPVITTATGTMAGKAYLYGSLDGVNFVLNDSLALATVTTNTTIWTKTNPVFTYWRITVGGATTVTATASAIFSGKRANTLY